MRSRQERLEYAAGVVAVVATGLLAVAGVWPFHDAHTATSAGSVWDRLLDPTILGFLRLALLVVAVYGIASVPLLVVGGRWVTSLGTTGVMTDEIGRGTASALDDAERRVADLEEENARLLLRIETLVRWLKSESGG